MKPQCLDAVDRFAASASLRRVARGVRGRRLRRADAASFAGPVPLDTPATRCPLPLETIATQE